MATTARLVYGVPGSLYARCGGVFGISSFVDRCMDRWMADKVLNDNPMVTRWHLSAQRPGFKFLVAQLTCNMTGGPQQYTGRPMADSHKHLNISSAEWARFMDIFLDVCREFGLPPGDQTALNALMVSMMEDIVIAPGERPPSDPGPMRPRGDSLYARLGGVCRGLRWPLSLMSPLTHIAFPSLVQEFTRLRYLWTGSSTRCSPTSVSAFLSTARSATRPRSST